MESNSVKQKQTPRKPIRPWWFRNAKNGAYLMFDNTSAFKITKATNTELRGYFVKVEETVISKTIWGKTYQWRLTDTPIDDNSPIIVFNLVFDRENWYWGIDSNMIDRSWSNPKQFRETGSTWSEFYQDPTTWEH